MIKFIESGKMEVILISIFIIAIALNVFGLSLEIIGRYVPRILILLYLLRILVSFGQWRLSRGISIINAYLNFQICYCVLAIGVNFLNYPGHDALAYNALLFAAFFTAIPGIFFLVRWRKMNIKIYWYFLKWNVVRAIASLIVCLILFYALDISSQYNKLPTTAYTVGNIIYPSAGPTEKRF